MADNTATKRKVEDYLKRCPGRSATTSDIANGTGVPLQLLQKLLYQLKNKKVVFKHEGMTPPKWSLRDQVVMQFRYFRPCAITRGTREFCSSSSSKSAS